MGAIALGRSWSRSKGRLRPLWGTRQGRSAQRSQGPGRALAAPHVHVMGPTGPGHRAACSPVTRAQIGPHNGKGHGGFYAPVPDPWPYQATWAGEGP